jgi:hypothetical protein
MRKKFYSIILAATFTLAGCGGGGYTYGKVQTTELIPTTATVGVLYQPSTNAAASSSQNAIAYAMLKGLSTLHTSGKVGLVTWDKTDNADYLIEATGDTSCPPPSEAAIKGAAGALLTGLTFAFSPLGVSATPMSHVNAYITTYKKDKTAQVGKGLLVSSGSSVVIDCEKMMYKVASRLHDQQFIKPISSDK